MYDLLCRCAGCCGACGSGGSAGGGGGLSAVMPCGCGPGSAISCIIIYYAMKFTSSFILSLTYLISNLFNHFTFTITFAFLSFLLNCYD